MKKLQVDEFHTPNPAREVDSGDLSSPVSKNVRIQAKQIKVCANRTVRTVIAFNPFSPLKYNA